MFYKILKTNKNLVNCIACFGVLLSFLPISSLSAANPQVTHLSAPPPLLKVSQNTNNNVTSCPCPIYNKHKQIILADIQDRIDTIDQAGLYVLISKVLSDNNDSSPVTQDITPTLLLDHPDTYRGKLLKFDITVDPQINSAKLSRSSDIDNIYYVTAQISFDENRQRVPAIVLLTQKPTHPMVDQMTVTGYFYMVLRSPTRQADPKTGRNMLDYLVFLARDLSPGAPGSTPVPVKANNKLDLVGLLGTLLVVFAIWIYLRRKTKSVQKIRRSRLPINIMENNMTQIDPNFPGTTIMVDLAQRSYPIYVGSDILSQFGKLFQRHAGSRRTIIITDENVGPLYQQSIITSLGDCDIESHVITVPPGESSKRMATVEMCYDRLFDFSAERSDTIIALGGGVVGDMAGFVAATFKRGLNFVQVPTSLLAMVDSSIGGKTGINHPRGKNMIGAFYQPKLVFADTATLKTLPTRELGCGLAETVKHTVIRDGLFFEHLENHTKQILDLQQDIMIDLVTRNCRIKAEVVSTDERESGLRRILNYGHTIGHTFETVLSKHDFHHGEAVSLGIIAANKIAQQRDLLKPELADRIEKLLKAFDLPTRVTIALPVDDLYDAMLHDKKVKAGKIVFVLPTTIGNCTCIDDVTTNEIKTAILSLKEN